MRFTKLPDLCRNECKLTCKYITNLQKLEIQKYQVHRQNKTISYDDEYLKITLYLLESFVQYFL